jgi:hypothetical protein
MKGRKISEEEFIMNYTNVRLDEINKKPPPVVFVKPIHNPVTIRYWAILKTTWKAYLFQFEDGVTYWFPKSLCAVVHATSN